MWYSSGTVTATNNSNIVTGVSTQFIANVRVGDGITIQGSSALHEVINIASNTQLTIKPNYMGATGGGKQFACAPLLGYDKDLSDAFNQLRLQFGDKLANLKPWAYAATANAALDGLGFSASGKAIATETPEQGRTALGLGTAATRNVGTSSGNVMEVGAGGWLGRAASDSYIDGYPQNIDQNISQIYRREGADVSIPSFSYAASIHFAVSDTWGRLRVHYAAPRAWIQGGTASAGTGWTVELIHTGNILTTTGQSSQYPMTQKAVTDAINGVSDRRDKVDITPNSVGLDLIEKLEPVCFRLNKRDWYRDQEATSIEVSVDEDGNQTEHEKIDSEILSKPLTDYDNNVGSLARDDRYTGLIAQDVKAALEDLGLGDLAIIKNYSDEYDGGDDRHYIEYMGLIPIMINAIKELSDKVKTLENSQGGG